MGWLFYRKNIIVETDQSSDVTDASTKIPAPFARVPIKPMPNWGNLIHSEYYLDKGIRYSQQRAIIHYHLASIYLTRLEMTWQSEPDAIGGPDIGGKARNIDIYITRTLNHWRNANNYDIHGRSHTRLVWLYSRVNGYKDAWDKRQLIAIRGSQ